MENEIIINSETSFKDTVKFLKKYLDNVKVLKNKNSILANRSQNFYTIILFENRGEKFSIKWNYNNCELYFGDITKNKKTCLQYAFKKMKFDNCYPIEEGNNSNIVFWEYEIIFPNDYIPTKISPLRMPIILKQIKNDKYI